MSAATAKQTPAGADRYLAAFEARWRSADELTALRRTALEAFLATGFPTQRDEEWKYTNLRRLESRSFALAEGSAAIDAQSERLDCARRRAHRAGGRPLVARSVVEQCASARRHRPAAWPVAAARSGGGRGASCRSNSPRVRPRSSN